MLKHPRGAYHHKPDSKLYVDGAAVLLHLLTHLLQEPGATVLVVGATGGVGQVLTAKLLEVCTLHQQSPCRLWQFLRRLPFCSANSKSKPYLETQQRLGSTLVMQTAYRCAELLCTLSMQWPVRLTSVQLVEGDCRKAETLKGLFNGVDAVVCVIGTTAFPSAR